MHITAGEYKKKRILGPPESAMTRPLPSVVKEAMFNLLRGHWEGARVLDAFAGTGSFGLEAISRGAEQAVFFEKDRAVVRVLERNAENLGCLDRCDIVCGDALGPAIVMRCPKPVDIVLFDPPYPMVRSPEDWVRVRTAFSRVIDCLADTGFAVLRTPAPFYHMIKVDREEDPSGKDATERMAFRDESEEFDEIVIDGERMVEFDPESDDPFGVMDAGLGEGPGSSRAKKKKKKLRLDVSLRFDNADGPETHVYNSTALHLYMKKGCG